MTQNLEKILWEAADKELAISGGYVSLRHIFGKSKFGFPRQ
jgi:hypothetical protein